LSVTARASRAALLSVQAEKLPAAWYHWRKQESRKGIEFMRPLNNSLLEDYEVTDAQGDVIGYSCDLKIYIETSVFNFYFSEQDEEKRQTPP
jgi:hypothetical protein